MGVEIREGEVFVTIPEPAPHAPYDWASLAERPWASTDGPKTLQDYWRINPDTGRVLSKQALKHRGELVSVDGVEWLIFHLTGQALATFDRRRRKAIENRAAAGIRSRLLSAKPRTASLMLKDDAIGNDERAQLAGVVCRGTPFAQLDRLDACLDDAVLVGFELQAGCIVGAATSFKNAVFMNDVVMREVLFEQVDFEGSLFIDQATFEGSVFDQTANFFGCRFEFRPSFRSCRFDGPVFFSGSAFRLGATFAEAQFNTADFVEVAFVSRADFTASAFAMPCSFARSYFGGETAFNGARIAENSTFEGAVFSGGVTASDPVWKDRRPRSETAFGNAVFGNAAAFKGAWFRTKTSFQGARFGHHADFATAHFTDETNFAAASFGRQLTFSSARFEGFVSFLGADAAATRDGEDMAETDLPKDATSTNFLTADFSNVVFHQDADFQYRTFSEAANFKRTVWAGLPLFHGATFDGDIIFDQARFPGVDQGLWPSLSRGVGEDWRNDWARLGQHRTGWPSPQAFDSERERRRLGGLPPLDPRGPFRWARQLFDYFWPDRHEGKRTSLVTLAELDERYARLERAFRSLSEKMKATGAQSSSTAFFKLLQKARRRRTDRSEVGRAESALSWLYDVVSDYGDSLWRPLAFWLLISGLMTIGVWGLAAPGTADGASLAHAAQLTLQSAFKPFDIWNTPAAIPTTSKIPAYTAWLVSVLEREPLAVRVAASVYAVVSLTLLFLFGLAVRRKMSI